MRSLACIEVILVLLLSAAGALCPSRCICDENLLKTVCENMTLQVVPIQLNPNINILVLSNNRIGNIEMTFNFYTNLIDLDLSHNRIRNIGSYNFESQKNLQRLDLSFNQLKTLHKDAFKGLYNLNSLSLASNEIQHITDALAYRDLDNLNDLNLAHNGLVSIKRGVFNPLVNLKRLQLQGNQILALPEAVITLPTMQKLYLGYNLLKEILLPDLPQLMSLSLRGNVLCDINNDSFSGAPNLVDLDLSDNNLTRVPTESLAHLEHLRILNLSSNTMQELKGHALRGLYKLVEVHLDSLPFLRRIDPQVFADNQNLQTVSISDNVHLRHWSRHLLSGKTKLRHVKVSGNGFSTLHASDLPLDQLHTLRLGRNPFHCNCSLLWLWLLKENQSNSSQTDNPFHPVILDLDQVWCELSDRTGKVALKSLPRSELACSSPWILWVSVSVVAALAATICGVVIFLVRQRLKRRENPVDAFISSAKSYEDRNHTYYTYAPNVKCLSNMYAEPRFGSHPPPLIFEKKITDCDTNIYQEPFAVAPIHTQPHIVYV